ncbi:MAG TPA: cellulase family glycosylhydrolase [Bacteroidota bacterium]|nr:cellulase family glycosylhydrolase [Bacteroidota bacterium]
MQESQSTKLIIARVNTDIVRHTMRGGIGASWHAMSKDIPLENEKYDYPVRHVNPRGSGYGGNPPVSAKETWDQIYRHASWLGLNFIRVELSQRMYEPARGAFDWENEEMLALYNILDWCESNQADVFLQQMWGHVEWNAFPGVHPLLSAPRSVDDFAEGIKKLLDQLIKKRKYSCIKYFCITNEPPGGTWGYWWSHGSGSGTITPALRKTRQRLDDAGIDIPLSGPDWTSLPPLDPSKIDFDDFVGAYDIHSYDGIDKSRATIIGDWVGWAHGKNKPFFLTELGNMKLGWGGDNPGPKSFGAALSNASDIVTCLNLGVDGINRWSFVNRGDMDGQWQLIQTWDRGRKMFLKQVQPESFAYYGFGVLSRFIGKYAAALESTVNSEDIKLAAVKNKTGEISIFLLNSSDADQSVALTITGNASRIGMFLYQVSEKLIASGNFRLEGKIEKETASGERTIVLPAKSISALTSLHLKPDSPGIII